MQGSYKVCPKCGQAAAMDAQQCSQCGRVYRTQFTAGMDQTQFVPHMNWTPPPQVPQQTVIDECSEQYHRLTIWRIISFLTMPAIFGVPMWFVLDSYDMNLRSKVAAQNMNADHWESQVRPRRMRTFQRFWRGVFACVGIVVIAVLSLEYVQERQEAERQEAQRIAEEQERSAYRDMIQNTTPSQPAYNPPGYYSGGGPYGGATGVRRNSQSNFRPGQAAVLKSLVRHGMTADQINRVLGAPDTIESTNGQDYWVYRREDAGLIIKFQKDRVTEFGLHPVSR
jgi:hypothetical protein